METEKKWWMSRTIWTGLATAIYAVLSAAGVLPEGIDMSLISEVITGLLGIATVAFRVKATTTIAPVVPTTTQ